MKQERAEGPWHLGTAFSHFKIAMNYIPMKHRGKEMEWGRTKLKENFQYLEHTTKSKIEKRKKPRL